MIRIGMAVFATLALAALPVSTQVSTQVLAQTVPPGFPLDRTYRGISISGFDVQRSGLTLTVRLDKQAGRVVGSGSGGCNNWTATFLFREGDQLAVSEVVTTRKACAKARMTTEQAFLRTLRSAQTWSADGKRLILEGDAGRLLLTTTAKPAPRR